MLDVPADVADRKNRAKRKGPEVASEGTYVVDKWYNTIPAN